MTTNFKTNGGPLNTATPRKIVSISLSLILLSQAVLTHALESNFWASRRRNLPTEFKPAISNQQALSIPTLPTVSSEPLQQILPFGTLRRLKAEGRSLSNKRVLHIQDIHLNAEAQSNIAKALERLIAGNHVSTIALEGAFEPISLSEFHSYPHQDSVREVADFLLKQNRISGPIYAALTTPSSTVKINGVDDRSAHRANVAAYQESYAIQKETQSDLTRRLETVRDEKAAVFNPDLKAFDQQSEDHRQNKLSLGNYLTILLEKAGESNAPNAKMFVEAAALEQTLDFSTVEAERGRLIADLAVKLSSQEKSELVELSVAYRLGRLSHADFFNALKRRCEAKGISLASYAAMNNYIRYVGLVDNLDSEAMFQEQRELEQAAYAKLVRTDRERELVQEGQRLHLMGKLVAFSLTSDEWNELKGVPSPGTGEGGRRPGEGKTRVPALTLTLSHFGRGNKDLESFERFYQHAEIRDKKMAQNLLRTKASGMTVLVTGGFHSKGIDRELINAGYDVVSFVPKMTKVDGDGSAYLSVFNQEKTPLDRLFDGEKLFLPPEIGADRLIRMVRFFLDSVEVAKGRIDKTNAAIVSGGVTMSIMGADTSKLASFFVPIKDGLLAEWPSFSYTSITHYLHEHVLPISFGIGIGFVLYRYFGKYVLRWGVKIIKSIFVELNPKPVDAPLQSKLNKYDDIFSDYLAEYGKGTPRFHLDRPSTIKAILHFLFRPLLDGLNLVSHNLLSFGVVPVIKLFMNTFLWIWFYLVLPWAPKNKEALDKMVERTRRHIREAHTREAEDKLMARYFVIRPGGYAWAESAMRNYYEERHRGDQSNIARRGKHERLLVPLIGFLLSMVRWKGHLRDPKDRAILKFLLRRLNDPDPWVVQLAAKGISQIAQYFEEQRFPANSGYDSRKQYQILKFVFQTIRMHRHKGAVAGLARSLQYIREIHSIEDILEIIVKTKRSAMIKDIYLIQPNLLESLEVLLNHFKVHPDVLYPFFDRLFNVLLVIAEDNPLSDQSDEPMLIDHIETSRVNALRAIARLRSNQTAKFQRIYEIIRTDSSDRVQETALWTLGRLVLYANEPEETKKFMRFLMLCMQGQHHTAASPQFQRNSLFENYAKDVLLWFASHHHDDEVNQEIDRLLQPVKWRFFFSKRYWADLIVKFKIWKTILYPSKADFNESPVVFIKVPELESGLYHMSEKHEALPLVAGLKRNLMEARLVSMFTNDFYQKRRLMEKVEGDRARLKLKFQKEIMAAKIDRAMLGKPTRIPIRDGTRGSFLERGSNVVNPAPHKPVVIVGTQSELKELNEIMGRQIPAIHLPHYYENGSNGTNGTPKKVNYKRLLNDIQTKYKRPARAKIDKGFLAASRTIQSQNKKMAAKGALVWSVIAFANVLYIFRYLVPISRRARRYLNLSDVSLWHFLTYTSFSWFNPARRVAYENPPEEIKTGAIGKGTALEEIPVLAKSMPWLDGSKSLAVERALAELRRKIKEREGALSKHQKAEAERVIHLLEEIFVQGESDMSIGLFNAIARSEEDYLLAFAGYTPQRGNVIGLSKELFTPRFLPHLPEILFHEGLTALLGEPSYEDHRKFVNGIQRALFGKENPLKSELRSLIDGKLAELNEGAFEDAVFMILKTKDDHHIAELMSLFGPGTAFNRTENDLYKAIRDIGHKKRIKSADGWVGFYPEVDAESARPTGRLVSFQKLHKEGILHQTSELILMSEDGRVIVQHNRKGYLDWSASGHVEPGQSPVEAAIIEGNEELELDQLGIKILPHDLIPLRSVAGLPFSRRTGRTGHIGSASADLNGHYRTAEHLELNEEQNFSYVAKISNTQFNAILHHFTKRKTEEVDRVSALTIDQLIAEIEVPSYSKITDISGINQSMKGENERRNFLSQLRHHDLYGTPEAEENSPAEKEEVSNVVTLSDDASGRREIEDGLVQSGENAVGISDPVHLPLIESDKKIVVNLGTRALEEGEIAEHLKKWKKTQAFANRDLGLKIDSTLRGGFVELIENVAELHESDLIVLVPANPKQGRVVKNARIYVHGEPLDQTFYGREIRWKDRPSAHLPTILQNQRLSATHPLNYINSRGVRYSEGSLMNRLKEMPRKSVVILDAETTQDLSRIAAAVDRLVKENPDLRVLRVGSAGLLNAKRVVHRVEKIENKQLPLGPGKGSPVVFVTSRNMVTRNQMRRAAEQLGKKVVSVEIDVIQLMKKKTNPAEVARVREIIKPYLKAGLGVQLTTSIDGDILTAEMQQKVAYRSAKILDDDEITPLISSLFVSGGDAVEALEKVWETFADVQGRVGSHIPWGVFQTGRVKGLPIISKAGGFGADDLDLIARHFEEKLKLRMAITQGDPMGVGPELSVRLFLEKPEILKTQKPFVIGNAVVLGQALELVRKLFPHLDPEKKWEIRSFNDVNDIWIPLDDKGNPLPVIPVLNVPNAELEGLSFENKAEVKNHQSAVAQHVEDILALASRLAREGRIHSLVREPINKERIMEARKARGDNRKFIGHTEYLAEEIGTDKPILTGLGEQVEKALASTRMILTHGDGSTRISVIHASRVHQSLKDAVEEFTTEDPEKQKIIIAKTAEAILRAARFARKNQGKKKPRIAINGLAATQKTDHAGVKRALEVLVQAIDLAEENDPNIEIVGPVAAGESYTRALFGEVDFVVALYHDQGHIPLKLASALLDLNKKITPEELEKIGYSHQVPKWKPGQPLQFGNLRVYSSNADPLPVAIDNQQEGNDHPAQLFDTIKQAYDDLKSQGVEKPRIMIGAINPHSGEGGKFGSEDQKSSWPAVERALVELPDLVISEETPVPADAVFIQAIIEKADAVIMPQQDSVETAAAVYYALQAQGRLLDEVVIAGVNVTEGMKDGFVSTSVDHGTAEKWAWQKRHVNISLVSLIEAYEEGILYASNGRLSAVEEGVSSPHNALIYKRADTSMPLQRYPFYLGSATIDFGFSEYSHLAQFVFKWTNPDAPLKYFGRLEAQKFGNAINNVLSRFAYFLSLAGNGDIAELLSKFPQRYETTFVSDNENPVILSNEGKGKIKIDYFFRSLPKSIQLLFLIHELFEFETDARFVELRLFPWMKKQFDFGTNFERFKQAVQDDRHPLHSFWVVNAIYLDYLELFSEKPVEFHPKAVAYSTTWSLMRSLMDSWEYSSVAYVQYRLNQFKVLLDSMFTPNSPPLIAFQLIWGLINLGQDPQRSIIQLTAWRMIFQTFVESIDENMSGELADVNAAIMQWHSDHDWLNLLDDVILIAGSVFHSALLKNVSTISTSDDLMALLNRLSSEFTRATVGHNHPMEKGRPSLPLLASEINQALASRQSNPEAQVYSEQVAALIPMGSFGLQTLPKTPFTLTPKEVTELEKLLASRERKRMTFGRAQDTLMSLDGATPQPVENLEINSHFVLDSRIQRESDFERGIELVRSSLLQLPNATVVIPLKSELRKPFKDAIEEKLGKEARRRVSFLIAKKGFYKNDVFDLESVLSMLNYDQQNTVIAIQGEFSVKETTWNRYQSEWNYRLVALSEFLEGVLKATHVTPGYLQNIHRLARASIFA